MSQPRPAPLLFSAAMSLCGFALRLPGCLRHQLTTAQLLWTGLVMPTLSAVTFKTCQSPLLCSELCNQNGTERASCDLDGQWHKKI